MSSRDAAVALRRFGLGARPGEIKRIATDPRGFVLQSLAHKDAALIADPALQPSHVTFTATLTARREQKLARASMKDATAPAAAAPPAAMTMTETAPVAPGGGAAKAPEKPGGVRRGAFRLEAMHRLEHATHTEAAFLERLVMFWSNHFCVSAAKGIVGGVAGAYEREVIRPNVLGRFGDMLAAAVQHPAMLVYLDNQLSTGPRSRAGINRGRGLNENLAREILELHTVGVDAGYGQEDVTNFARILTGWTVGNLDNMAAEPGKFFFAPARHEPGDWTVLGKRYRDQGQLTGQSVLRDLALHPATAHHLATKLARHFVAEDAPPVLVERIESKFRDSGGDLAAVAKVLVETPQAWDAPATKILPPYDFLVAITRGLALVSRPGNTLRLAASLGQPLWRPPSPAGWPDGDTAWAAPAGVRERLRIAELAAREADHLADPNAVTEELLGDNISTATRQAVARAETREQGIELLIMSPEFQRR